MLARSTDGLTYTQTDTWITDQAQAPDVVQSADGTLYAYYSGWVVGDYLNRLAVALSHDQGETWNYKYVQVNDRPNTTKPTHPDVVILEDGTFRLYYSSMTLDNAKGIFYAESTDGFTFEHKGTIVLPRSRNIHNATVMKIQDTWHFWGQINDTADEILHLTSTDGVTFDIYAITSFPVEGEPHIPSNGHWVNDTFYLHLWSPATRNIRMMQTKNGFDWYPVEEPSLAPKIKENFVKDASITRLEDGSSLMLYVTNTP